MINLRVDRELTCTREQQSLSILSDITVYGKYAKYLKTQQRREIWSEIVTRNAQMHVDKYKDKGIEEEIWEAYTYVLDKKIFPSMRSLQFSGKPIELSPNRLYNCAFSACDDPAIFSETMFLLLGGSGVGYSVQKHHVEKLPEITGPKERKRRYLIGDSIEGWADAVKILVEAYFYNKSDPDFDFRDIREKGTLLKTSGGRAPGAQPLKDCLHNIRKVFDTAKSDRSIGCQLTTLEVHDIMCLHHDTLIVLSDGSTRKIGEIVKNKESVEVVSFNEKTGLFEPKKITNWYKNDYPESDWMRIQFEGQRAGKHGPIGGWFTNNHKFLTKEGWKEIQDLTSSDYVNTGEYAITAYTEQMILGSLLGDASLVKQGTANFVCSHTEKQKDYVDHKKAILSAEDIFSSEFSQERETCISDRNYESTLYGVRSKSLYSLAELYNTCYKNDKKTITKEWCDKIDVIGLAYWYMDDGSYSKKKDRPNGYASFASYNISFKEIELLQSMLKRYNIDSVIDKIYYEEYNSTHFRIRLNVENSNKLFEHIKDYVTPSMQYKLPEKYRTGKYVWPSEIDIDYTKTDVKEFNDKLPLYLRVLSIDRMSNSNTRKYKTSYCIDVEDNHNFKTFAGIVHNCHIADAVLAGGIRRAALISLFSFDDNAMLTCKYGHWWELNPQRARANNSAVVLRHKIRQKAFFEFWEKVKASGSGEPGIYFTNDKDWGSNPCCEISLRPNQFCVSGDTKLITKNGITTIEHAIDTDIEIWNGEDWSKVKPFKTGDADKLWRVQFSDGSYLDATANHKFLAKKSCNDEFKEYETLELLQLVEKYGRSIQIPRTVISGCEGVSNNNAYEYGFFLGDGFIDAKQLYASIYNADKQLPLKGTKYERVYTNSNGHSYEKIKFDTLNFEFGVKLKTESINDIFTWNENSILNFMAGWIDADGSYANKGCRLYGNERNIRSAQLLLTKIGIYSSVNLMERKGSVTNLGIRKNDVWYLQIPNASKIPSKRLNLTNGITTNRKGKYQIVRSVTPLEGEHKSYCLTENKLHQCVFNNVLTKQCNLVTLNGSDITCQEDLNQRAKYAARIATYQAGWTDFHYLRPIWQKTTEKEALIGVSITGIASGNILGLNLKEAAEVVLAENARVAKQLGINKAARCTCIKPEGTVSCVAGTSSGIHAWHSPYYIRRMRLLKQEALYKYLVRAVPNLIEDDVLKPTHEAVISLPIKAPDNAIFRDENTIHLLERGKKFFEEWIATGHRTGSNTHNVSMTASVRDNDWDEIGRWMWDNRSSYNGIAVIPHNGGNYRQMPFEECTKEQYEEMLTHVRNIDLTKVKEEIDLTDLSGEVACSGGACEINRI